MYSERHQNVHVVAHFNQPYKMIPVLLR